MRSILTILGLCLIVSGCAERRLNNDRFGTVIHLKSPNGGEFIRYGSTVKIKWESQNVNIVNVHVTKLGKPILGVTRIAQVPMYKNVVPEDGEFIWYDAGMDTGGSGPYTICVSDRERPEVGDCSDDYIVIRSAP